MHGFRVRHGIEHAAHPLEPEKFAELAVSRHSFVVSQGAGLQRDELDRTRREPLERVWKPGPACRVLPVGYEDGDPPGSFARALRQHGEHFQQLVHRGFDAGAGAGEQARHQPVLENVPDLRGVSAPSRQHAGIAGEAERGHHHARAAFFQCRKDPEQHGACAFETGGQGAVEGRIGYGQHAR